MLPGGQWPLQGGSLGASLAWSRSVCGAPQHTLASAGLTTKSAHGTGGTTTRSTRSSRRCDSSSSRRRVWPTTWRRQALGHSAHFLEANAFHYDYGQNAGAAFSATLYTGHDGDEELEGGWTAFVSSGSASKPDDPDVRPLTPAGETLEAKAAPDDANPGLQRHPNGSAVLSRGLVVAPRIGRLLLFSGGAENYHAPLPVGRGRRQSLQIFFGCRSKS